MAFLLTLVLPLAVMAQGVLGTSRLPSKVESDLVRAELMALLDDEPRSATVVAIELAWLIDFRQYFAAELAQLQALQEDGLVQVVEQQQMNDALTQYGYPKDAILSPALATTLAKNIQARFVVPSTLSKGQGGRYSVTARVLGVILGDGRGAAVVNAQVGTGSGWTGSGWVMRTACPLVLPDVFADARVPHDVYRRTFVKSLAMVPVRILDQVSQALPELLWLDRMSLQGGSVELQGQAFNTNQVATFNCVRSYVDVTRGGARFQVLPGRPAAPTPTSASRATSATAWPCAIGRRRRSRPG